MSDTRAGAFAASSWAMASMSTPTRDPQQQPILILAGGKGETVTNDGLPRW
jgi:hypothetical protein